MQITLIADLMIEKLNYKNNYREIVDNSLSYCLKSTSLHNTIPYKGKVRDMYDLGDMLALITTDRQSAFDRILASIPFKGQVLNQTVPGGSKRQRTLYPIM